MAVKLIVQNSVRDSSAPAEESHGDGGHLRVIVADDRFPQGVVVFQGPEFSEEGFRERLGDNESQTPQPFACRPEPVICDGCNVFHPHEHRCHGENAFVHGEATGKPCECPLCFEIERCWALLEEGNWEGRL